MNNRNNNSQINPSTNEAYESDVDLEKKYDENYTEDYGTSNDHQRPVHPPIRNPMSGDNLVKTQLSGIPEEKKNKIQPNQKTFIQGGEDGNKGMKMRTDNMSLSNFRTIHGDDTIKTSELQRDAAHSSIIQMKHIPSEPSIQTGRNFRKNSTFVITPKISVGGEEKLHIRLVDNQNVPELFIELDSLQLNPVNNQYYWIEKSRFVKFEEEYNQDTEHFSSPHVASLSMGGVSNFRKLFIKGELQLDYHAESFPALLNKIKNSINKNMELTGLEKNTICEALSQRHLHAGEHLRSSPSELSMFRLQKDNPGYQHQLNSPMSRKRSSHSIGILHNVQRKMSHANLDRKLDPSTESLSIQVGAMDVLDHTYSLLIRLDSPIMAEGLNEVNCPLRFVFVIFGPKYKEEELFEVGRVFAVMMTSPEFREIAYSANTKEEFIEASKLCMTHSVIVPLSKAVTYETLAALLPQMKCYFNGFLSEQNRKLLDDVKKEISSNNLDIATRIGKDKRQSINPLALMQMQMSEDNDNKDLTTVTKISMTARQVVFQFCPPLRHFINEWRGLKSRYISDYKDAFTKENAPVVFIGMIFIYFVAMAPAITFGALLNAVNPKMTMPMMFLASGSFLLFLTVFGGQPLEIIGMTGPVFAADKVLGSIALSMLTDLGAMRFFIGVYISLLGIVFVCFNGVLVLKHIRRSVEEIYNFLVSEIYILSALFSMFKILPYSVTAPSINGSNINVIVTERLKFGIGGTTLFLAFFMANFCLILVHIKKGNFYRRQLRRIVGSLNVPLGIILVIVMQKIFFESYTLPTLNAPPSDALNFSLWVSIPTLESLKNVTPAAHGFCFLISISVFAIITVEVSCNSILVSKVERKLLKPSLYTINYFYMLVLFPLISGTLGWPFVSGAPVRSHANCMAMSLWSLGVPGVPAKITGAAEQRISGIFVGSLVLLSVFLGSALRYIPMASMYGMFLYMGVMGSVDLIFIRRTMNILRRRKYWKGHDFLKDFPTWNVSILLLMQITFIGILTVLYCIAEFTTISWTPLLFSLTILTFAFVRGYILPRWPRLNTHLSKMDKKHPVKLYADQQRVEKVILTVNKDGVNVTVVDSTNDVSVDSGSEEEYSNNDEDLW